MNEETERNLEKIYIIQPILDCDCTSEHEEAVSLVESADAVYVDTIFQKIREISLPPISEAENCKH